MTAPPPIQTSPPTQPPSPAPPRGPVEAEPSPKWGLVVLAGLLAWVGIQAGWPMLVVILALVIMIFMHELGHFLAAKRAGMKVTEFFLGFGPRLWSFRRGETEYGIKAIWLGAYVKVIGMNNLDEVDPAEEHRTYRAGRYRDRLLLAVAGSAMHFVMAIVMLYVLIVGYGNENPEGAWEVAGTAEGSPAAAIGLEPGDSIVAIDGVSTVVWEDLVNYVAERDGVEVAVTVDRDGEILELSTTLQPHPDRDGGYIGISRSEYPRETENLLVGVPVTAREYGYLMKDTVFALGDFFRPSNLGSFIGSVFDSGDDRAGDEVGTGSSSGGSDDDGRIVSLVGATRIGADLTENGLDGLLAFLVMINTFVGVFNLVPLLPLDGGHVAVATYEKIRSRRGVRYHVDVAKLLPLTYAVLAVLAIVGVSAIYLDIADPIQL